MHTEVSRPNISQDDIEESSLSISDEFLTFKYPSFMHNSRKIHVHLKFDSVL